MKHLAMVQEEVYEKQLYTILKMKENKMKDLYDYDWWLILVVCVIFGIMFTCVMV